MSTEHRTILPHHREQLADGSGLTDETIRGCGIYSETDYRRLGLLLGRTENFVRKIAPALVFPFKGPDGSNGYCRIKPDRPRTLKGKPVKYESPLGKPNEVFIPPGTLGVLDDPAIELVVTEGEKKSARADQEGFRCLGLVGVWGWKTGKAERLLPSLEFIKWKKRPVIICFDSDIDDNPDILAAESRLAAHLQNQGAIVKVARLPAAADGSKVGIDDYLLTHTPGEFRKLLDDATLPEPVPAAEMRIPAKHLDAHDEAQSFLREVTLDSAPRLRFWQGNFYWWSKGRFVEMTREEIRAEVIRFLNRHFCGLTTFVVGNLIDQLKSQAAVGWKSEPPCWLDKPGPWPATEVIVVKNGIFHLPSVAGGIEPFQAELTPGLFTQCALNYGLRFDSPPPESFLQFLSQLWPGDPQSIDCLQEWFGYLLSPDTSQQKILTVIGPTRSGKGTLAKVIKGLVGKQNVIAPSLSTLATHFGLASLVGKSIAIIPDARISGKSDKAIAVENMLSISGEDTLTIPRKFREDITVRLPTRLVLFSNELPKLTDASGALAGRMIILQLTNTFFGREDTRLDTKLLAELPSILLWAIEGWRRLNERGRFLQPDSGREIADDMMNTSSDMTPFVEECCEIGPDYRVEVDELYKEFKEWCTRQGKTYIPEKKDLGVQLRAKFPKIVKRRPHVDGGRTHFYHGIRISLHAPL